MITKNMPHITYQKEQKNNLGIVAEKLVSKAFIKIGCSFSLSFSVAIDPSILRINEIKKFKVTSSLKIPIVHTIRNKIDRINISFRKIIYRSSIYLVSERPIVYNIKRARKHKRIVEISDDNSLSIFTHKTR